MAKAYPNIEVHGYDLDAPSIEAARANAKAEGVSDRVKFFVKDASDPGLAGQYDLVTAFEMVHDLSHPVEVLQTMHRLAGDKGSVLIVDERVGEMFRAKVDEVERMMYGWSISICLATGKADKTSAETGTVMRPDTLRKYASEAGFKNVEILPIDNYFFRFYRLH
jgi:2-polyprenyl-3-methyl-5-hydroxy-6-metoxy-1,4-benzoquinol methylase